MTISSTTRIAGPFAGNALTVTFPFTFKVFATTDLSVSTLNTATQVTTPLVLGVDYTAVLNANQDANPGGSITTILTAGPLAVGITLTITSAVANLQLTQLLNQGGFYPDVITTALDRLTILIQQLLLIVNSLTAVPCVAIVAGSTYQAPGNVAAVFVNGNLQDPTAFTQAGGVITFLYALNLGDNVNALCTLL